MYRRGADALGCVLGVSWCWSGDQRPRKGFGWSFAFWKMGAVIRAVGSQRRGEVPLCGIWDILGWSQAVLLSPARLSPLHPYGRL